jgi:hypothetical protein
MLEAQNKMAMSACKAWVIKLGTTCAHCKVAQLIGVVMLGAGVLIFLLGFALSVTVITQLGGLLAFTGMVAALLTRFGAWWHHN